MTWEEVFNNEAVVLGPPGIVTEITNDLFLPDKISPIKFFENYMILLSGSGAFMEKYKYGKEFVPTPSLEYFKSIGRMAPIYPPWFHASHPDVMKRICERQYELVRLKKDLSAGVLENLKESKVSIDDDLTDLNNKVLYFEKKWRPKYLKNISDSYKEATGKKLETSL